MAEEVISLRDLTKEEAEEIIEAFEVFKKHHGIMLNAAPRFTSDGRIEVDARFVKVVQAPKEEGFQVEENGGSNKDHAES